MPKLNPSEWLRLAIAAVVGAAVLSIGFIGWKGRWFERLYQNERAQRESVEIERGSSDELSEGLDGLHQRSRILDRSTTVIYRDALEASSETVDDGGRTLPRMARADTAWRSGIERMCPDCAPGGSEDSNNRQP